MEKQEFSEEDFFTETQQPPLYEEVINSLKKFVLNTTKNLVLITSGGTTVPLEKNTVRFIDNFSGGGRGSASAEYFLKEGYAVIFLHRKGSLSPFARTFSNLHENMLDFFQFENGNTQIKADFLPAISEATKQYTHYVSSNQLLLINFTSVQQYLWLLKGSTKILNEVGSRALIFASAAVSDFYIPAKDMAEHKIQSAEGPLQLTLQQVPKMLRPLCFSWAPKAFVISFKLETDKEILAQKALKALKTYKHQLVIANLLQNYRDHVEIYSQGNEKYVQEFNRKDPKDDIEADLIPWVANQHQLFINKKT